MSCSNNEDRGLRNVRPVLDDTKANRVHAARQSEKRKIGAKCSEQKHRSRLKAAMRLGDILALATPGVVAYRILPWSFETTFALVWCLRSHFGCEVHRCKVGGVLIGLRMNETSAVRWQEKKAGRDALNQPSSGRKRNGARHVLRP